MNNKKTLKNILEEKINQEVIYENILEKQKNQYILKKWIFVPICFFLIGLLSFYPKNIEKSLQKEEETNFTYNAEKNTNASTNEENNNDFSSSEMGLDMKDTIYRFVDIKEDLQFPFFASVLPKDLKIIKNQKVYYKENYVGYRKIYKSTESYRVMIHTL